jgi:pectinacetylesterase
MVSIQDLPRVSIFLLCLFLTSTAKGEWQRIDVNAELLQELYSENDLIVDDSGHPGFYDDQDIARFPGCSEGPQPFFDSTGQPVALSPTPYDGHFSFFIDKNGASTDWASSLLIYLAGGGACWDAATCVGSALTPASVYFPTFFETLAGLEFISNDPFQSGVGGILTRTRSDNPYSRFAKVFIPYCTGDAHIGSRDTTYSFDLLGQTLNWNIRHRGYDNLLVVLKWLQKKQNEEAAAFSKLTVAGSSAGGYGALINFPVIRYALGESPDYSIIIDSANGILTDGFLERAFGSGGMDDGVWGVRQNVAHILQPILDMNANFLWVSAFDIVGSNYRDTRISQSTAAFDLVQGLVRLNMQKVDDGSYNPFSPPTEQELNAAVLDWSFRARFAMRYTAYNVPNYRFYLGAGFGHVHLLDPPTEVFPFPTTNYFAENSARGVEYTDWLDDMLNNPRRFFRTDWRNLSCFPNCLQ